MDRGIILKEGTTLWGAHPKILRAVWVARNVLNGEGVRCVVTSLWDHAHSENSFHHYGMAVDIRSKELASLEQKRWVRDEIQLQLGDEFEVFLEGAGTVREHFHIEWEAGRSIREKWLAHIFGGQSPTPVVA